jgi:tetratricopeptide (TPR) repeat protein
MSDRDSNNSLKTLLNQTSAVILAVISLISGVYGFVKLFGDQDAGLITLISISMGVFLLLGICLYYARFWKPERQDKGNSAFVPPTDQQVRAQAKIERQRKQIRRSAIAGIILIPILSCAGIAAWFYLQSLPAKNVIVLVAEFDSPDAKTHGVTETILRQLRQATEKYADVEIQALKKSITEQEGSEVARAAGQKRKATIVIWGWYRNLGEVVPLSVHFEVLRPPTDLPELGQTARGNIQQAAIADLKGFTLQTRLSKEMSYLSLFTLGMARRAAGDLGGAIDRFSNALNQNTDSSSGLNQSLIYFYRGNVYLAKGDYDLALADFNQSVKIQPTLAEAYSNRSSIYIVKNDYTQALADANQAVKLKPDLAIAHNNRGVIYATTGNYDGAIADFSQTLKLIPKASNPARPDRTNSRQISSFNLNSDRENPIASFLTTDLSDYLVYVNRGFAYLSKGDYDRAIADFNQAIQIQPDSTLAYFNRAAVYFAKQDYDRALTDLNQVIQLQPNFDLAYVKRGSVYSFKGDYDRALADLDHAIQLQSNSAFFYTVRGEIYFKRDDLARAIADFSQAIKLQPNLVDAYYNRGRSYREKGDYDRAIADYDQAIKLEAEPKKAKIYNGRGWTYAQAGKFDQAIADLNQAIKLKPDEANFYDSRGFAYAGKREYDQAISDYNQALKLKPEADYAYYHRGIVYRTLGDRQKAIADFKRTLELTKNSKRRQDAEKQIQELPEAVAPGT